MKRVNLDNVKFETADIVLFDNDSFISRVIKWFSYKSKVENQVHHSGTISEGGLYFGLAQIVESWARVIETYFYRRGFYKGARIEVWRSKNISKAEKLIIGDGLKRARGSFYGFKYIPLYGLDLILSKIAGRRVFYFRSKVTNPDNVICSVLTLQGYFKLGYTFGLKSPFYATPEYLQDWMKRNPDKWELVYVLKNDKASGNMDGLYSVREVLLWSTKQERQSSITDILVLLLKEVEIKQDNLGQDISELKGDVKEITTEIRGNGHPGINERIRSQEKRLAYLESWKGRIKSDGYTWSNSCRWR